MSNEFDSSLPELWKDLNDFNRRLLNLENAVKMKGTVQRIIKENQDSVTIGPPSGGQVKIYMDFADPQGNVKRIENAFSAVQLAKRAYEKITKGS